MGMRFDVLGPLRVAVGGVEIAIDRPARRRLLALLLLEPGRRQSTDTLIDRFWASEGDAPTNPKATLQTHLSALRGSLPDGTIITEGYGYRLPLDGHELDALLFTEAAAAARRAAERRDWSEAEREADAALALWRGDPFPDLSGDVYAQPELRRLEEVRLEVEETHVEALMEQGRTDEVLPRLEVLVADRPLRERRWEHLMLARFRQGRQAESLDAYLQARQVLAEIGVEPGHDLQRLQARILRQDPTLVAAPAHNLPAELSTFIGRDRERRTVARLTAEHRLVTLTGVGGAGKTRLALRVAHDLLCELPDGAWVVELAPLRDRDAVLRAVATTVGARPAGDDVVAALRPALRDRTILIVLDNCEHLLEASAATAKLLLEVGEGVRVLATSREPLAVPGETVYRVPPMSYPADAAADVDELRRHDAVRLFEDRAALARPGYRIDEDVAAAVELCRRLDGVPLAIELAAARARSLTTATIADRLDQRFRLLTSGGSTAPPRQRTLEATVRWSYDLLLPIQQTVFARLGVFQGAIALPAAEHVATGDGVDPEAVVPVLSDLVDRSLVTTSGVAPDRYRLLETLRAFAVAELERRGDALDVRRRHRDWFLALAEDAPHGRFVPGRREAIERLEASSEDLAAALTFSREDGSAHAVVGLARALAIHWSEHGHVQRAIEHLELALQHCDDVATRAVLRSELAAERFSAAEVDRAFEDARAAVELVRRAPSSRSTVEVLSRYAKLHLLLVDRDAADGIPIVQEGLEVAEQLGDPYAAIAARVAFAQVLGWSGEIDAGLEEQRRALERAEELNDPAIILEVHVQFLDLLYLHPTQRRSEPARMAHRLLATLQGTEETPGWYLARIDWVPYALLQDGSWAEAERLLDRTQRHHREGYQRTWHLMVRATLRWMQGRTGEARDHLDALWETGLNPRWFHDYFPLRAEVAADEGELEEVRAIADHFLRLDVDDGEMPYKLAVLTPVVRAEVDAALASDGEQAARHAAAAEAALEEMRRLAAAHPHPTGGSVQLETAATHVAFAEAELSRLRGGEPVVAWRRAEERADFAYYRLYAGWRLAEAAVAEAHPEAATLVERARSGIRDVGAHGLARELDLLAGRGTAVP